MKKKEILKNNAKLTQENLFKSERNYSMFSKKLKDLIQ